MYNLLEPRLQPVPLASLRPTQMTVGMIEVDRKRRQWLDHVAANGPDFLGSHMIPVVLGPKKVPWLIDHHHLARALHDEGVEHVLVSVVARLCDLRKTEFLTFMDNRNWLHPYDAKGTRCDVTDMPRSLGKLTDDPYRSLAGAVRQAGGYAKTDTPYSEFLWADFLRGRIPAKMVAGKFEKAVNKALEVAHGEEANHLPGYCGTF
ncbi:chromosome partitioning protein ParB [Sphingomonas sp. QA11]|uniref:ParB-like protein n=1 Tax=Sphingomonas sp. QA11 TaxID=2950605 RepID=UPI002349E966|nr:ParB-like protein [Sphingomonas sp. QA11]WCM28768.1 chromosome partitioning protein ParB [Sphingomonas sp. QA11]